MCRHIWRKVSAHLMKSVGTFDARANPSPCFGRNLHYVSGETSINLRAKLYKVMLITFIRLCLLPLQGYAHHLRKVMPITFIRLYLLPSWGYTYHLYIPYSLRYSSHLNPFLGMKSLKSVVQNIIRLLHQWAISFCHWGIAWFGFVGSRYGWA